MANHASGTPLLEQANDLIQFVFEKLDVPTLVATKVVSKSWHNHTREPLLQKLLFLNSNQTSVDATDLDVEALFTVGRVAWEIAAARRMLPNLKRIHGFGFSVDVDMVSNVNQGGFEDPEDENDEEEDDPGDEDDEEENHPFGGEALRACIQPEDGSPPPDLLVAAIACAASVDVHGIPVRRMRDGDASLIELNLEGAGLGSYDAQLLGLLLPNATSLRQLECVGFHVCPSASTL